MASDTEIANLALGHVGVGIEIADLETENSAEAIACRRFYDTALEETLRAHEWPFATGYVELSLIEENPNDEWGYSYAYPTGCVYFRKILSGVRQDSEDTRIAYELANDEDVGTVIYTDQDEACGKYTRLITSEELYPHDFTMAFSYVLASYIFPMLMQGDPFNFKSQAIQWSKHWVNVAASNAFNESKGDKRKESQFVRGR